MCTKRPYPNRWTAEKALAKLRDKGYPVVGVHPCYQDHPGCWHVTRQRGRSGGSGGR